MKSVFAWTVLLSAALSGSAALAQSDPLLTAADLVKAGEAAAAARDWDGAKAKFLEATQADPTSAVAFYDLGVAQAHLGEMLEAIESEHKALAADAKFVPAFVELGWIQCQRKDYDSAIATLSRALEIDPGNKLAQKNLDGVIAAKAAAARKQVAPVLTPARVATATPQAVSPSAATLIDTGIAAFKKGQLESAKLQFEQAIIDDANSAQAHANLGVVLGTMGNYDQQAVEEKRAVQLDPKNAHAWVNLGWAESKLGKWAEALTAYQKALALSPMLHEAQCGQAIALFHQGKEEAGIAAIKVAIKHVPHSTQAKVALADMLERQSRFPEAESQLREALRLSPNNSEVKQHLAVVLKLASKSGSTR